MAVFQQNMQFLSTESGEHQQRQKEGVAIETNILWTIFQVLILRTNRKCNIRPFIGKTLLLE
jgi:hypothetical protein